MTKQDLFWTVIGGLVVLLVVATGWAIFVYGGGELLEEIILWCIVLAIFVLVSVGVGDFLRSAAHSLGERRREKIERVRRRLSGLG